MTTAPRSAFLKRDYPRVSWSSSFQQYHPCHTEMKFICLTVLIISGATYSRSENNNFVRPADPVFALAGEDVILPCSVKFSLNAVDMRVEWSRSDRNDSEVVHLYEDHEDRNTNQSQSYRGRTKLNHEELHRGNISLKLSSVQVSDEGRYKCSIQSEYRSGDTTVNFTVGVVGRPPVITVDGFDYTGLLRLKCESEGWYPEPVLEWMLTETTFLSSETAETHRNENGFSVKHTVTVYEKHRKIHCRIRLKNHKLDTLIITSSNMFQLWRKSAIQFPVIVGLGGFTVVLIAVIIHKYIVHRKLKTENRKIHHELDELLQSQRIPKVITHLETDMVNATLGEDSTNACLIQTRHGREVIYDETEQ
ncbi:butyrophilin-like protein 10 isoform X1 [Carassius gibelio]|uniref:butyrophilin-like protein 10 isoform X1 n=1 Tax=Carassius gibelio TaxID=101364 RepID=UPI002279A9B3|nr:butyrophilin-like protein 10 isoform X1 [Carassius gibelio]XP_052406815.1 butyrophilin-like protein 10 isoform X1 [Carassius gibelio]